MKHSPLAVLKLPLLLLALALLLATGGILWGHSLDSQAQDAMRQQQAALNRARLQLDRSRQQQRLITAHQADYQALASRGFVGKEDRLAWIEAVQVANREAGLYGVDYRLAPRIPAQPALAEGLPLGQTSMTLTLPLLVETDLGRFLGALKERAPGIHRVRGCRLSRLDEAPFEAVNRPHLQAECELLWYTVGTSTEGGK